MRMSDETREMILDFQNECLRAVGACGVIALIGFLAYVYIH